MNIISSPTTDNPWALRFSQKDVDEDFYNLNSNNIDPKSPSQSVEMIRQQGLANGIVLTSTGKRTANFETGDFQELFVESQKE